MPVYKALHYFRLFKGFDAFFKDIYICLLFSGVCLGGGVCVTAELRHEPGSLHHIHRSVHAEHTEASLTVPEVLHRLLPK